MTAVAEKPKGYTYVKAKCLKAYFTQFKSGLVYDLILEKLTFNGPVTVIKPMAMTYASLKDFRKDWEIQR